MEVREVEGNKYEWTTVGIGESDSRSDPSRIPCTYITYSLSHRRFIKERWWDRKADAYGNIIGSLVGLIHSLNLWIEMMDYPDDFAKGHSQEELEAMTEAITECDKVRVRIERAVTEGDYVISKRASMAMSELMRKLKLGPVGPHDWFYSQNGRLDWLPDCHTIAKSCLEVIRVEA